VTRSVLEYKNITKGMFGFFALIIIKHLIRYL
jgi:hypothetical protein